MTEPEAWEDRCRDCDDTGITIQTERRCACQPPLPKEPAMTIDSVELERLIEIAGKIPISSYPGKSYDERSRNAVTMVDTLIDLRKSLRTGQLVPAQPSVSKPGWDVDGICNDHGVLCCQKCALPEARAALGEKP